MFVDFPLCDLKPGYFFQFQITDTHTIKQSYTHSERRYQMKSYLNNRVILGRLIFVLQAVGDFFLFLPRFCGVVRRYVVSGGLQATENTGGIEHEDEVVDQKFACETRGLLYLDRQQCLTKGLKKSFKHFHDFTLNCGAPIGTILMSSRSTCRRCNGKLLVVVFYHI